MKHFNIFQPYGYREMNCHLLMMWHMACHRGLFFFYYSSLICRNSQCWWLWSMHPAVIFLKHNKNYKTLWNNINFWYKMNRLKIYIDKIKMMLVGESPNQVTECRWFLLSNDDTHLELGLYSLSDKTSYRQISRSLEAARLGVIMIVSLWNLTGISAAVLPRCLSNFRAMVQV